MLEEVLDDLRRDLREQGGGAVSETCGGCAMCELPPRWMASGDEFGYCKACGDFVTTYNDACESWEER